MRRIAETTAVAFIGLAFTTSACSREAPRAPEPGDPTDATAIAEGEAVYLAHCASCHGTRLEGQPGWQEVLPDGGYPAPPHDGSGHTWRHSDRQLFEATKFGGGFSAAPDSVSHMPPFEHVLSDDQIWASLAFVKSRWPAELQARQRLLTRRGSHRQQAGHEGHGGHSGEPVE